MVLYAINFKYILVPKNIVNLETSMTNLAVQHFFPNVCHWKIESRRVIDPRVTLKVEYEGNNEDKPSMHTINLSVCNTCSGIYAATGEQYNVGGVEYQCKKVCNDYISCKRGAEILGSIAIQSRKEALCSREVDPQAYEQAGLPGEDIRHPISV